MTNSLLLPFFIYFILKLFSFYSTLLVSTMCEIGELNTLYFFIIFEFQHCQRKLMLRIQLTELLAMLLQLLIFLFQSALEIKVLVENEENVISHKFKVVEHAVGKQLCSLFPFVGCPTLDLID